MNKRSRLLVVDDELDERPVGSLATRRQLYRQLEKRFEVRFVDALADVVPALRTQSFDAVIFDWVLARWNSEALDLLKHVPAGHPIVLISQHWTPNFDRLTRAIAEYPIATVFTWEDLTEAPRRELVEFWLDHLIREQLGYSGRHSKSDDIFRILQVSDVQFGSAGPIDIALEKATAAQILLRECGAAPDVCAITGDISERGLPSEFDAAKNWLLDFLRRLDEPWDSSRNLVVPGNHDVCRAIGLSARVDAKEIQILPADDECAELKAFAFEPYRGFELNIALPDQRIGRQAHWVSGRYARHGVIFFGYNTSEILDEQAKPTARLDGEGLAALHTQLTAMCERHPEAFVVGLMHHPLVPGSEQWQQLAPVLGPLGTSMIMTGHVHQDDALIAESADLSVLQVVAGTLTKLSAKRGEDTLRGCNVVELHRIDGRISEVVVRPFRFERGRLRRGAASSFSRDEKGRIRKA